MTSGTARDAAPNSLSAREIYESYSKFPGHVRKEARLLPMMRRTHKRIAVSSYRALMRLVGLCWYRSTNQVLLRGQTRCFENLRPSACRSPSLARDPAAIDGFLERFRRTVRYDQSPTYACSTEPLLQHYGVRTRWVDFVDSVPQALFFATHDFVRSPFAVSSDEMTYVPTLRASGVLYVVDVGVLTPREVDGKTVPGVFSTDWGGEVCDLRRAKPSQSLRPHMQHGWLCRPVDGSLDLWNRVVLQVEFDSKLAREWLVGAGCLTRESLFPDKKWDETYKQLLSKKMTSFFENEHSSIGTGVPTRFDFHSSPI